MLRVLYLELSLHLMGLWTITTRCTGPLPIHGSSPSKAALYRDRFQLLSQRLSRNPHFSKPAFEAEMTKFGSCEVFDGFPWLVLDTYFQILLWFM